MKFWKKAAAVIVAAAVALSGTAFAETTESTGAQSETAVIDISERPETTIIDPDAESGVPESGVDLSDSEYTAVDISGFTEWDGKSKMQAGTNYYISKTVKLNKKYSIPEGSTLVVCSGAQLLVYKGYSFGVRGKLIAEPKSTVTISGTYTVYAQGATEIYGKFAATKSSTINILSEFIIRHNATGAFSGRMNVYKDGMFLNYGSVSLTAASTTKITGELQSAVDGRLMIKGYIGITINGRATVSGYFSLTGEFVNSGVFIFESTARYYKSKSARFAVSKSSRLIDYRLGPDAKPTTPNFASTTDVGLKGIDVSYAQGAIDWKAVKASGVDFAMIRASRGYISPEKPMAEDVTFKYNVTEANAAGLKVGVYHYLYASTVSEARKEAKFFLKTIAPYKITYPVVLDVEEMYQAELGKKKITNIVKAFLEEISAAGYYAMLYSNKAWLTNYLDMSQLQGYDIWLAQWNAVPTYEGDFGIWQYSCKGIVSGINGYVDLNLCYRNYTKIIRDGKYNNLY